MGIRNLRSCVLNRHSRRVDIATLAHEWRSKTGKRTAVAVVDGSNILHDLTNNMDAKSGGNFKELVLRVQKVIKTFQAMGITTVWFFDGNDDDHRRDLWIDRKCRIQEGILAIYREISYGFSGDGARIKPAGVFETIVLTLKELGVEVHMSKEDGDRDLARYAKQHECFCILSADMDFALLPGANYLLSCAHYDMGQDWKSTVCFEQEATARGLGISREDLPLLGALLPNDFIPAHLLKHDFYGEKLLLITDELYILAPAVANYLSKMKSLSSEEKVQNILSGTRGTFRKKLKTSIDMYDFQYDHTQAHCTLPQKETAIVKAASERLWKAEVLPELHMIVSKGMLEMSPALENPLLPSAARTHEALRPLRARIYGVLQLPNPIKEWYPSSNPGETITPVLVKPVSLGMPSGHPGVLALWSSSPTQADSAVKWRLMGWVLTGSQLSSAPEQLRSLPQRLLPPAATLLALHQSGALSPLSGGPEKWVRRLARACAACLDGDEETWRMAQEQVGAVSKESMHVAAIFMRTLTHVLLLNDALGHLVPAKRMNPANFFDGKVFQNVCSTAGKDAVRSTSFDLLYKTALLSN